MFILFMAVLATIIKELSYQKQLKNSNPEQIKMFCSKIVISINTDCFLPSFQTSRENLSEMNIQSKFIYFQFNQDSFCNNYAHFYLRDDVNDLLNKKAEASKYTCNINKSSYIKNFIQHQISTIVCMVINGLLLSFYCIQCLSCVVFYFTY